MKVLKEVTSNWNVEYSIPNHTYLVDGDKILAYKIYHQSESLHLTSNYRLDKRGRKFQELSYVPEEWSIEETKSNIITVQGSKGNSYEVDPDTGSCTCPGFQYRGKCKHIEILEAV